MFRRNFAAGGQIADIVGNAVHAPYVASYINRISDLQGASEVAALYDQYKINYVVWKYYLKIDPSAQAAGTAAYPRLYWFRDLDDSTVPSNLNEMRERNNVRVAVMRPDRPVTIKYKPNCIQEVWAGVGSTTYIPKWSQWLDMSVTNTPHYGHKIAIDDLTNTNYRVTIEATLYFSCKNQR